MRGQELIEPIFRIPTLGSKQLTELDEPYRITRDMRLRIRAQMVLLPRAALTSAAIAEVVCSSQETVRRWLKRCLA